MTDTITLFCVPGVLYTRTYCNRFDFRKKCYALRTLPASLDVVSPTPVEDRHQERSTRDALTSTKDQLPMLDKGYRIACKGTQQMQHKKQPTETVQEKRSLAILSAHTPVQDETVCSSQRIDA